MNKIDGSDHVISHFLSYRAKQSGVEGSVSGKEAKIFARAIRKGSGTLDKIRGVLGGFGELAEPAALILATGGALAAGCDLDEGELGKSQKALEYNPLNEVSDPNVTTLREKINALGFSATGPWKFLTNTETGEVDRAVVEGDDVFYIVYLDGTSVPLTLPLAWIQSNKGARLMGANNDFLSFQVGNPSFGYEDHEVDFLPDGTLDINSDRVISTPEGYPFLWASFDDDGNGCLVLVDPNDGYTKIFLATKDGSNIIRGEEVYNLRYQTNFPSYFTDDQGQAHIFMSYVGGGYLTDLGDIQLDGQGDHAIQPVLSDPTMAEMAPMVSRDSQGRIVITLLTADQYFQTNEAAALEVRPPTQVEDAGLPQEDASLPDLAPDVQEPGTDVEPQTDLTPDQGLPGEDIEQADVSVPPDEQLLDDITDSLSGLSEDDFLIETLDDGTSIITVQSGSVTGSFKVFETADRASFGKIDIAPNSTAKIYVDGNGDVSRISRENSTSVSIDTDYPGCGFRPDLISWENNNSTTRGIMLTVAGKDNVKKGDIIKGEDGGDLEVLQTRGIPNENMLSIRDGQFETRFGEALEVVPTCDSRNNPNYKIAANGSDVQFQNCTGRTMNLLLVKKVEAPAPDVGVLEDLSGDFEGDAALPPDGSADDDIAASPEDIVQPDLNEDVPAQLDSGAQQDMSTPDSAPSDVPQQTDRLASPSDSSTQSDATPFDGAFPSDLEPDFLADFSTKIDAIGADQPHLADMRAIEAEIDAMGSHPDRIPEVIADAVAEVLSLPDEGEISLDQALSDLTPEEAEAREFCRNLIQDGEFSIYTQPGVVEKIKIAIDSDDGVVYNADEEIRECECGGGTLEIKFRKTGNQNFSSGEILGDNSVKFNGSGMIYGHNSTHIFSVQGVDVPLGIESLDNQNNRVYMLAMAKSDGSSREVQVKTRPDGKYEVTFTGEVRVLSSRGEIIYQHFNMLPEEEVAVIDPKDLSIKGEIPIPVTPNLDGISYDEDAGINVDQNTQQDEKPANGCGPCNLTE